MNHEQRLEQQFLFGQGFTDTPFAKDNQSQTLGYLRQMLAGQQQQSPQAPQQPAAPSMPQAAPQGGMTPPAALPGSAPAPRAVGPQGRLVTTDEQGRRVVIPPQEAPAAESVMQASAQGQPLTMAPPDQLTAPREQGAVPPDLMRLPVAARMKTFNERMAEVPAQNARLNAAAASLDNVADTAKLALSHESLGPATGLTGMVTSRVPGTGAYNVNEIIQSSNFFSATLGGGPTVEVGKVIVRQCLRFAVTQ